MKIEVDRVSIVGGVRGGETLGSPIALVIENADHWREPMAVGPFLSPPEPLTRARPGHADLAGGLKYDRHDLRDVLERASARETAARTAAGAVARVLLRALRLEVFAHVVSIGDVDADTSTLAHDEIARRARTSDLACADPAAEARMRDAIRAASHDGDTLGGTFEVIATNVIAGLGSHVAWDRRLDGRLAQALMSIPAIKAVAIGDGVDAARRRGSSVHDPIGYDASAKRFVRSSNHAGGVEGGMSNGEPLSCTAYMKPISTVRRGLPSVDVGTKEPATSAFERSDVCAVAAASVVGEAMVCLVLADAMLEKLGGDSISELERNLVGYRAQLEAY
jgi:chorismate synthase